MTSVGRTGEPGAPQGHRAVSVIAVSQERGCPELTPGCGHVLCAPSKASVSGKGVLTSVGAQTSQASGSGLIRAQRAACTRLAVLEGQEGACQEAAGLGSAGIAKSGVIALVTCTGGQPQGTGLF